MRGAIAGEPFEFDIESVRFDEAEALERALGVSFKAWTEQLAEGRMSALRGLVWLIRRRQDGQHQLRFDDVSLTSLPLNAITVDDEPGEDEPGKVEIPESV